MRGRYALPYRFPVSAEDAPPHTRYPGVLGSYRSGGDACSCLASVFSLHTESVNVWTVLASLAFFVVATTVVCARGLAPISALPAFATFVAASVVHAPFAVGFHLLMPMSLRVFNIWRRLDIMAIFVAGVCFAVALASVVFPWRIVMLNGVVAAAVAWRGCRATWSMADDHVIDNARHVLFVGAIVLSYWAPMLYYLVAQASARRFTLASSMVIGEVASMAAGGAMFALHVPQRFRPGAFDVFGHSHQMMHVAAMVAHVCKFVFMCCCVRSWQQP